MFHETPSPQQADGVCPPPSFGVPEPNRAVAHPTLGQIRPIETEPTVQHPLTRRWLRRSRSTFGRSGRGIGDCFRALWLREPTNENAAGYAGPGGTRSGGAESSRTISYFDLLGAFPNRYVE